MTKQRRYTRKSVSKAQSKKTKFRRSAKWTKFRRALKAEHKFDPITGSRLSTTANCHHLCLNEEKYEDLSDKSHFVMLNTVSHDVIHFFYSSHNGWRKAILATIDILKRMDKINGKGLTT